MKNKTFVIVLGIILSINRVAGQAGPVGARSMALGGIRSGIEDAWSAANNPAGLAGQEKYAVAINLDQRYLMAEMGFYSATGTIPAGKGCLGITTVVSGNASFYRQRAIIGYGMSFGERLMTGISLEYDYQTCGQEYPSLHQVSYALGTFVVLSPKVSLAFSTFNPFRLYYKNRDYSTLSSIFDLGFIYHYAPVLSIYTEIEKDLDFPMVFKTGIECQARNNVFLQGGISLFPAGYSFGAAYRSHRFLLEISSSYHQYLGFSPAISLQYEIK